MKRLGVLGTFIWDTIRHPDREDVAALEQWGGIIYSLSAFSALCPSGWTIVPVVRLGADLASSAADFLADLPAISSTSGVRVVSEPTIRVELCYRDRAERTERLTGAISSWTAPELLPILSDLDALYINYLSGFEMDLDAARAVRDAFRGPVYADLHSLVLGPPGEGPRMPRRLPDAGEWLSCADVVQVNEIELSLLGAWRPEGAANGLDLPGPPPQVLLVTRGAAGAAYRAPVELGPPSAWPALRRDRDGRGHQSGEVGLPGGPLDGDPTGCGDVWGAAVFSALLDGWGVEESITRGHRVAAAKMRTERIEQLAGAIATTRSG